MAAVHFKNYDRIRNNLQICSLFFQDRKTVTYRLMNGLQLKQSDLETAPWKGILNWLFLYSGIKVTSLQPTSRLTHISSHGRPQMTIKQEQGVDPQMEGSPHDMMGAFVDSTTFPSRPTPPLPFPHQENLYLQDVQNGELKII